MVWTAVLFDLEGVLLKGESTSKHIYEDAVENALRRKGISTDRISEEEKSALIAPDEFSYYREICNNLGIDPESFWIQKEDEASSLEIEYIKVGNREMAEGARDVLDRLGTQGVPMGVVSNNSQTVVEFVTDYFCLDQYLDTVHGLNNTIEGFQSRKPEPHYLSLALEELDVEPSAEGVAYVGDRFTDIRAAREAGIRPIYVGSGDIEDYSSFSLSEVPDLG